MLKNGQPVDISEGNGTECLDEKWSTSRHGSYQKEIGQSVWMKKGQPVDMAHIRRK